MSVVLFDELQSQIEVIIDTERNPWFKRAHVGKFLSLKKILMSVEGLDKQEMVRRDDIDAMVSNPYPWSGPKDQQNKTDIFLSIYGVFYVIVRSKKHKGKELREWVMRDIIPRGLNDKIKELKDKHDGAIEDMTERIEAIQLESEQTMQKKDDLDNAGKQLVDLEHENHELQNEVERLQERYVPYLQDTKKNNGMVIIQKNNGDEYPYVAICGQQGYVTQKIQNKLVDYPNAQLVVLAETPNAIVHYNWLRERGCIIANPDRVRHFRLGENYMHRQLMELQEV